LIGGRISGSPTDPSTFPVSGPAPKDPARGRAGRG
jgi:hypothetical protein